MRPKIQEMDDQSLWVTFINGNQDALTEIWQRFHDRYHMYARHLLNDRYEAEDMMQNVFMRLLESREALPLNANIENYLQAMVKNTCISHLRRKKSKPTEYCQEDQLPVQIIVHDPLVTKESVQLADEAIAELPPAERKVFEQKNEGFKHKEIAQRTGKSVQTVRNQYSNANKTLRKKLLFLKGD